MKPKKNSSDMKRENGIDIVVIVENLVNSRVYLSLVKVSSLKFVILFLFSFFSSFGFKSCSSARS